ncbi:porin family protein [Shewanella sp. VB17]|uniref:porin family protein n=1 Tax=Shewanella sp. VB17 TaxID=2739432 RepID=UPI001566CFA6|nr:porin family protein [Shewanella sp. VB17]NRD74936.1 porin family protein [Shewanella sp. VB17]
MKKLRLLSGIFFILLLSTSATAAPDIQGYYMGGMAGYSELSLNDANESASSFGGYAGYSFGKDLSFESTFFTTTDLGEESNLKAKAATFAAKLNHFFNPSYSMFIKVGVAKTQVESDQDDYSASGWMWGVGFNFAVTTHVNVRLAYEKILAELENSTINNVLESELSNVYLGVNYQF